MEATAAAMRPRYPRMSLFTATTSIRPRQRSDEAVSCSDSGDSAVSCWISCSSRGASRDGNFDFDPSRYIDSSGLGIALLSVIKIVVCFLVMMITTAMWSLVMLLLLPWPYERIKQGNLYGHVTGRLLMWILGNPIKITGKEHSNLKAIYVCNHASPLDIFLVMWLTPLGTVGIAKKEIIWYPLFGQLYVLANHLRIDRSNPAAAIRSLNEVAKAVLKQDLSLIIFPEGTRSATGRLLPFKKGVVHIALQTRRPIVPIVLTGTHLAWHTNSLRVRPAPLTVKFLPPISTEDWLPEKADSYLEMLRNLYIEHLPESQRPVSSNSSTNK